MKIIKFTIASKPDKNYIILNNRQRQYFLFKSCVLLFVNFDSQGREPF
jgi:hypothetical protein